MSEQTVTAAERKRLFALMVVATEVTNRQLKERTGFEIERPARERLLDLKLITAFQGERRAWRHELTDDGWALCKTEMAAPLPEGRDPSAKLLQAAFNRLQLYFEKARIPLSEAFDPGPEPLFERLPDGEIDVDELIRKAYLELRPKPGAWVRLAELRKRLEAVVQADLDDSLRRLNSAPDVVIAPDSDRRRLTSEDRAAAVSIGGEDNHLLMVEGL